MLEAARSLSAAALVCCLVVAGLGPVPSAGAATPEEIKVVAKDLVCLCSSCNRESLATCTCTEFAVPERETIGAALDAGKTGEEIIADYVSRYGQMVLASPPPEGYKLLAWIAPITALILGVALVRAVLLKWRRDHPQPQPVPAATGSPEYNQRLQQELRDFDAE
ncbi:MAG: cytochrome c-type biogenesis protein CcmH [Candidatus Handelsmanbacteria bacterium]|nr:cytochrome c-type biogenesis protein CcmH [Candidatus Handelsmanbacteria bacterium]